MRSEIRWNTKLQAAGCWLVMSALILFGGCSTDSPAEPLNVLLISIDTLRADHLGFHGYARDTSPFLDRLAETSAVFENASSASSWTLPAHASMFLSQDSTVHGVSHPHRNIAPKSTTLVEILRSMSYRTAGFYSIALLAPKHGFSQGFEVYERIEAAPERSRRAERVNDAGLRWLETIGEQRFFLFLHYLDIHSPYASRRSGEPSFCKATNASGDWDYESIEARQVRQFLEKHQVPESAVSHRAKPRQALRALQASEHAHLEPAFLLAIKAEGEQVTAAERQCLIGLYDDGIRYLDSQLERLFGELDRRGLLDRTLVILTSDHGETLFDREHRRGHGASLHQAVLHVPLMVSVPGAKTGRRVSRRVSILDILPTILDYVGTDPPAGIQGRSLKPLIEGRRGYRGRVVMAELVARKNSRRGYPNLPDQRTIIRAPWKLILTEDREQLFHLDDDPGEKTDRSRAEPDQVAELRRLLTDRVAVSERLRGQISHSDIELDPKERRELIALGYLDN